MESSPTTERRVVARIFIATIVMFVVALLAFLIGLFRLVHHRTALVETLSRYEDSSLIASYEPYQYSAPSQIMGGLIIDRSGIRLVGFSVQSRRPFWADWVAKIFDDDPFAEIQDVKINGEQFRDADVYVLLELPDLRVLDLSVTGITDDGIALLAENSKLAKLDFSRTRISNRSLLILDNLPELRELDIANTNITKDAVQEFQKRHPDCLVFH